MRQKGTQPCSVDPAPAILRTLDEQPRPFEGKQISAREVEIRLLYQQALLGNVRASVELQRIRDESGSEAPPKTYGCLVVPEPISIEEFTKLAYEQQAPHRERRD